MVCIHTVNLVEYFTMSQEIRAVRIEAGKYPFINVSKTRRDTIHVKEDPEVTRRVASYLSRIRSRIADSSKSVAFSNANGAWLNGCTAFVAIPIGVDTETSEGIAPTFRSLKAAADQANDTVILIPYLNYTGDLRNDPSLLQERERKAKTMATDIRDMVEGGNVQLQTVVKHVSTGTTWPQLRTAMSDSAFSVIHNPHLRYHQRAEKNWKLIQETPYLQVDADTQLGPNAISTAARLLQENKAVFVNGTLHYTGGIMEDRPVDVAKKDTTSRLLYFIEHMRRRMFDHLPPVSLRGYLPDFGLGMKLGSFATIGGFEERSPQNESYFLQIAAIEALYRQWGYTIDEPNYPDAYIDKKIAMEIEGLVYYAPYAVDSSIRGIEANARKFGRNALIPYDQGSHYITWTDYEASGAQQKVEPEPSTEELLLLINSAYSAFKDNGGVLRAEDHSHGVKRDKTELNQQAADEMALLDLFAAIFSTEKEQIVFPYPKTIPESQRPRVEA